MPVRVRVEIEQDVTARSTPASMTFLTEVRTGGNPRFLGDAMQTAIVQAALDVCRNLAGLVDLRDHDVTAQVAAELLGVATRPGNDQ